MNAPHPWILPLQVISRARMLPAGFVRSLNSSDCFFFPPFPLPVSTCAALLAVPALCSCCCLCVCLFPFHSFHLHFASVLHSRSEITATGTLFLSGFFFCFITPEEMEYLGGVLIVSVTLVCSFVFRGVLFVSFSL